MTDETQTNESEEIKETLLTEENEEVKEPESIFYNEDQKDSEPVDEEDQKTDDTQVDDTEIKSDEENQPGDTDKAPEDENYDDSWKLEAEEGSIVDAAMLESIEAWAKDNSLDKEAAAGILKTQEGLLKGWVDSQMESHQAELDGWRDEVINDKILGGDNLKQTITHAKKTVETFATEEFKNLLRTTGYGDHPEVVRLFSKIGSLLSEDRLVNGNDYSGAKTIEEKFYGTNN